MSMTRTETEALAKGFGAATRPLLDDIMRRLAVLERIQQGEMGKVAAHLRAGLKGPSRDHPGQPRT
jgi:hypothetical protein